MIGKQLSPTTWIQCEFQDSQKDSPGEEDKELRHSLKLLVEKSRKGEAVGLQTCQKVADLILYHIGYWLWITGKPIWEELQI